MEGPESQYDIVLLGASGYTGKYTAEHIVKQLPTDLRWAVCGRSAAKLNGIIEELKPLNPDRHLPYVEVCTLDPRDLEALAKKTTVLINAVGPYYLFSEPVVKACAEAGTHYIDCTGEVPWVKKMIEKYEETAKKSGAIMIPQAGFESSPSDLLALSIVNYNRTNFKAATKDVTTTVWDLNSSAISGGSLSTALGILSAFSLREISSAGAPWGLAPRRGAAYPSTPFLTRLFGTRTIPGLGLVTTSITATSNVPIVQRSAILSSYGPDFRYHEYLTPTSKFRGVMTHWMLGILGIVLITPPLRWLVKRFVFKPGDGPSRESVANDSFELRAVGEADTAQRQRVMAKMKWRGSAYDWTGAFLAVGAGVLLRVAREREEGEAGKGGAGFQTPAMLGSVFVQDMEKAGMGMEVMEVEG